MKLKKFNTLLAIGVFGAGSLIWMGASSLTRLAVMPLHPAAHAATATDLPSPGGAAQANIDQWKAPSNAVEIHWRNYNGRIPGKVALRKWTSGDRTYYQMTGPINRSAIGNTWDNSAWGAQPAYEVFFPGSGDRYEQWLINPSGSTILHYNGELKLVGKTPLPASRFKTEVDTDQITITFWCHNHDTPSNLVFNYNGGSGTNYGSNTLSWATTGDFQGMWNHHKSDLWRYP
ncbi:MAG: hypothetical protein IT541_09610 [Hyphomicrobiales bacterium]|nr:hypothetical protein [Hyphomicrobiales bacterium]